jgi:hypothetical protein
MVIRKGTPCFISKVGHNEFIYPLYEEGGLSYFERDVKDCTLKPWICGNPNLKAVVVEGNNIVNLYGTAKTVVWVEKKHLKGI